MKLLTIALAACLSQGCSQPDASLFVGSFEGKEVTLTLAAPVDGKLKGVIKLRTDSFPAIALIKGKQLVGKFKSGDQLFDFSVSRDLGKYRLKSGGKTYALTKDGAPKPELAAASGTSPADAAPTPTDAEPELAGSTEQPKVVKIPEKSLSGTYSGQVNGTRTTLIITLKGSKFSGTMDSGGYVYRLRGTATKDRATGKIVDSDGGQAEFSVTLQKTKLKLETGGGAYSFRRHE